MNDIVKNDEGESVCQSKNEGKVIGFNFEEHTVRVKCGISVDSQIKNWNPSELIVIKSPGEKRPHIEINTNGDTPPAGAPGAPINEENESVAPSTVLGALPTDINIQQQHGFNQ